MSGPSDKAVQAAKANVFGSVEDVLNAAHDPALGLDRSVCLRDVVEALREAVTREDGVVRGERPVDPVDAAGWLEAADFIELTK
jgi:hypothetical protein